MKRQREKHITRLHIILFFLVIIIGLIIFISVKKAINNSSNKYKEYEKTIEASGENYILINHINISTGYEEKIDIKDIQRQGLIREEITNACKGYLIVRKEVNIYSEEEENVYTAYIKCGDKYKSVNYSDY